MATVVSDRNWPLLLDFLPRGDTINAAAYRETEKSTTSNSKQTARNADTRSLPAARQRETAQSSRHT